MLYKEHLWFGCGENNCIFVLTICLLRVFGMFFYFWCSSKFSVLVKLEIISKTKPLFNILRRLVYVFISWNSWQIKSRKVSHLLWKPFSISVFYCLSVFLFSYVNHLFYNHILQCSFQKAMMGQMSSFTEVRTEVDWQHRRVTWSPRKWSFGCGRIKPGCFFSAFTVVLSSNECKKKFPPRQKAFRFKPLWASLEPNQPRFPDIITCLWWRPVIYRWVWQTAFTCCFFVSMKRGLFCPAFNRKQPLNPVFVWSVNDDCRFQVFWRILSIIQL